MSAAPVSVQEHRSKAVSISAVHFRRSSYRYTAKRYYVANYSASLVFDAVNMRIYDHVGTFPRPGHIGYNLAVSSAEIQ